MTTAPGPRHRNRRERTLSGGQAPESGCWSDPRQLDSRGNTSVAEVYCPHAFDESHRDCSS
jgi:hypothetical protein